jgi:hypothetical protein
VRSEFRVLQRGPLTRWSVGNSHGTVPVRLEDTPSYLNFPGEHGHVRYAEGIYVGYRWYDARSIDVDYPFGRGLSYTTFDYSDLSVTVLELEDPVAFAVDVTVANSGSRDGAEVVQVYVGDRSGALQIPPRELRGFCPAPGRSLATPYAGHPARGPQTPASASRMDLHRRRDGSVRRLLLP